MAQAALRHIVFGLAAAGLLMGCVEGAGTGTTDASGAVVAPTRGGAARDIEAPEVFQTTDSALWDGRPSLGGIWVAAPEVTNPERVVMFNPATGKSVQGALFRRERDNPGPRLQISSDAAAALGILAGQPVELRVTALRRAEPEPEAEPEAVAAADPASTDTEGETGGETAPDPATTSDGDADAAATAAAATAALAATSAVASGAQSVADAATDPAGAVAAADTETAVEEAPKRKTWKERRAEARAEREARKAAADAAKAAAAAGVVATPEAAATAEAAGVAAVETAPLDTGTAATTGTADAEAAPVTEPPKTRRQIRAEDAAAAAAAQAAAEDTVPAEAAEAPALSGRLIQIASFSTEANATRAVEALSKAGITAQTRQSETGGKVVWGVVATGDAALLTSIKDAGFADAFFLQ